MNSEDFPLIIFAHIEKTGGTSLNGILRTYHGVRYVPVRALTHQASTSHRAVHLDDLSLYSKLAPWAQCVSGHAVRPWVLLDEGFKDGLFMSVVREPLARYVSYYTYGGGVGRKPWPYSFEEYLEKKEFHDFQTKRIAGVADANKALDIITETFIAVTVLEKIDELLEKLNIIWPGIKDCATLVGRRNVRSDPGRQLLMERYHDTIISNNQEDIKLYNLLKAKYDGLYLREELFNNSLKSDACRKSKGYITEKISALMRRLYLSPITGVIRLKHGLPYKGTY